MYSEQRSDFKVEVICAYPDRVASALITIAPDTTIAQAIVIAGLSAHYSAGCALGVYGQVRAPDSLLQPNDRVEIYRPLADDPKQLRLRRIARHAG